MRNAGYIIIPSLFIISCSHSFWSGDPEVSGVRSPAIHEPVPHGMVYIPSGHIRMGMEEIPEEWGINHTLQDVSVDAFWMDQTEVTNAQYRQFLFWVRDSIIRERLADPALGGNELYKITEDKYGDPVEPYLNWRIPIPWKNPDEYELPVIESIYAVNPVTGEKNLDGSQLYYKYEWFDHYTAAQYGFHPSSGYNKENITGMIYKDTAWIGPDKEVIRETLHRPFTGYYDFLNTYIINVHPDETCWVNDFENSGLDLYLRKYFNHTAYDNHPVVGVSWDMAGAYCQWRTFIYLRNAGLPAGYTIEPFRLPTEAEWEFAARTGKMNYIYPWGSELFPGGQNCIMGNFKYKEGDYSTSGSLTTNRVRSYPSNPFGLYDMAGNVAEWTSTGWSAVNHIQQGDLNPVAPHIVRNDKKVIKGGSWKDGPLLVRADNRTYAGRMEKRSWIGFRCVRTYAGIPRTVKRK